MRGRTSRHALLFATALLASVLARTPRAWADTPLRVTVTPGALRLTTDTAARVEITGPDVRLEALDVQASVGTLRALTRVGPGRFTAQYIPPTSRAPDVALIVARVRETASCGVASVPLAGRYLLTLTVEPHARVAVQIEGQPERTAQVHSSGTVDVALAVPPGVARAHIVATDRSGNRTETDEAIVAPALHRVMVFPAVPPDDAPRALRWLVFAATSRGELATREGAPRVEVPDHLAEVTAVAPGVFQVIARPPRRPSASVVRVRVSAPGAVVQPPELTEVVPPTIPTRVVFGPRRPVRAGETFSLPIEIRDESDTPVVNLESAIEVLHNEMVLARDPPRPQTNPQDARAPEQAGSVELVARVHLPGGRHLETRGSLTVQAGPATRVVSHQEPRLAVGTTATLQLRTSDRFGNTARPESPSVTAQGAHVIEVIPRVDGLTVRVQPYATDVVLHVRGDYDLRERIELTATAPPPYHPFALSLHGGVRNNLGTITFWTGRLRLESRVRIGPVTLLAQVEGGADYGAAEDMQRGIRTQLWLAPFALRLGASLRLGPVGIGHVGGPGGRYVFAEVRDTLGTVYRQNELNVMGVVAAIARVNLGPTLVLLEVGAEFGSLEGRVRGTIGGLYGSIGWGVVL